jgi:hypothetical protein
LAEVVAGAIAGGGIAQAVQQVLSQVASFVKAVIVQVASVGRQVLRVSYSIAKEIAKPEVGIPFSILLYNTAKLIRQNRDMAVDAVRSYFDSVKRIDVVGTVWSRVRDWISGFLYLSPPHAYWDLLNPFTVWEMINNSPWAPTWKISIFGAEIDLSVIPRAFVFLGLYPVFIVIALNIGFLDLLWRLTQVFITVVENIAVAIVGFVIDLVNFVADVMSFLACSYLKIIQPVIPFYVGIKYAGKGFGRAIRASLIGTLLTWVAIYLFAPECSFVQISAPSLPQPQLASLQAPTPSPAPQVFMIDKDVRPTVMVVFEYPRVFMIDKYVRSELQTVVGEAQRAQPELVVAVIDRPIRYSIDYSTTTHVESTIEKSLKPTVEHIIISPIIGTIEKSVKPEVLHSIITYVFGTIEKSVKPEVLHSVITYVTRTIDVRVRPTVEHTIISPVVQTIERRVRPTVEYFTVQEREWIIM